MNANDNEDRSCARDASGQYRAHVISAIASLQDPAVSPQQAQLQRVVTQLRKLSPGASDEDVASQLLNILTGSITATYKAIEQGLLLYQMTHHNEHGHIVWPNIHSHGASDALYDTIIASSLAEARRGSLDAVYRKYVGTGDLRLGNVTLRKDDRVIVWLGGTLSMAEKDNVFGIGVHKCPGMDMGKAIIEGTLRALRLVPGARLGMDGDIPILSFSRLDALLNLPE